MSADEFANRKLAEMRNRKKKYETKGEKIGDAGLKKVERISKKQALKMKVHQATSPLKKEVESRKAGRKIASTRYGREMAKPFTPKQLTKPVYSEAMSRNGGEGRKAFRQTAGFSFETRFGGKRKNSPRYKKPVTKRYNLIQISDPTNKEPTRSARKFPKGTDNPLSDNYVSNIVRNKRGKGGLLNKTVKGGEYEKFGEKYWTNKRTGKVEPLLEQVQNKTRHSPGKGSKDADQTKVLSTTGKNRTFSQMPMSKNKAKGSIAKRKKVREHPDRSKQVIRKGVGKSKEKERNDKRTAVTKSRRAIDADFRRREKIASQKHYKTNKEDPDYVKKRAEKNVQWYKDRRAMKTASQDFGPKIDKGPKKGEPLSGIGITARTRLMTIAKGPKKQNRKRPYPKPVEYGNKPAPRPKRSGKSYQGGAGGAGPGALAIRRPQDVLGVGRRK